MLQMLQMRANAGKCGQMRGNAGKCGQMREVALLTVTTVADTMVVGQVILDRRETGKLIFDNLVTRPQRFTADACRSLGSRKSKGRS